MRWIFCLLISKTTLSDPKIFISISIFVLKLSTKWITWQNCAALIASSFFWQCKRLKKQRSFIFLFVITWKESNSKYLSNHHLRLIDQSIILYISDQYTKLLVLRSTARIYSLLHYWYYDLNFCLKKKKIYYLQLNNSSLLSHLFSIGQKFFSWFSIKALNLDK